MPFSAERHGFDEQGRRVRRVIDGLEHPDPLMNLLAFDLAQLWQNNIDAGPNERWEAGASLRVQAFGGTTLRDRGIMKASIVGVQIAPNAVMVGSALTVGNRGWNLLSIHEFGATVRAVNAPFLVFRYPLGSRTFSLKTGKSLKNPVREYAWAKKKEVRIPRRPTSPYDWDKNQMTPAADRLILSRVDAYRVDLLN